MRQAWHIFKKDVRYLRGEIALLLLLALALYWLMPRGDTADAFGLLVAAAAGYTIARLIHAEAIPGENQFWVTRPYRWQSLLAAKLLFILVFVNLPVLLAQTAILLVGRFPVAWIVPGLLWMQVLVLICVALPLAMVATLTDRLATFFACILAAALPVLVLLWAVPPWAGGIVAGVEWLRDSIAFIVLAAAAPLILYLQYRSRRTRFDRMLAVGLVVCGACAYLFISWEKLFPLQARLSKESFDVQVVQRGPYLYGTERRFELWLGPAGGLNLNLPIKITGLPDGIDAQFERVSVSLEGPDGKRLRLPNAGISPVRINTGTEMDAVPFEWDVGASGLRFDRQFLLKRGQPLTLRATFYLTLFGHAHERTFTLSKRPTNVMDGIQCYDGYMNNLECLSAFRWPRLIVSQKSGRGRTLLTRIVSYSPFPSDLDLNPVVQKGTEYYPREPLPEERPVTLEVEEPLAYLRRDVVVRDLRLE